MPLTRPPPKPTIFLFGFQFFFLDDLSRYDRAEIRLPPQIVNIPPKKVKNYNWDLQGPKLFMGGL